uniref:Uncharacterized protein n=1 Tax=Opuntia streptacantha TaxID=393608 RepID=A0A7C9EYH9_OPUST
MPSPSHFLIRQITSGNTNRWRDASVARSKAVANPFSGKPGARVCGSRPKVKPQILSKVSLSMRSCRSTGSASLMADSRIGHSRPWMARLTHRAMACRRVRVVNSRAAVFL